MRGIEMRRDKISMLPAALRDQQQLFLSKFQSQIKIAILLFLNKMFNYFLLAPANSYSLSSLASETGNQREAPKERPVSEGEHSKLLERYEQLKMKYERVKQQNSELKEYVNELQDVFSPDAKKKKIRRRTESELSKEHFCPYPKCKKEYASILALNLHIRSKHQGGTKKERIAFIKEVIQAEDRGTTRPETDLKLCPELLQSELKSYRQRAQLQNSGFGRKMTKQANSSEYESDE